jgi:hypothetical protein
MRNVIGLVTVRGFMFHQADASDFEAMYRKINKRGRETLTFGAVARRERLPFSKPRTLPGNGHCSETTPWITHQRMHPMAALLQPGASWPPPSPVKSVAPAAVDRTS